MREINLAGKQYKVVGDLVKRAINPWMAKVSSGSREFSDFTSAQLEEYHDFRNGIGLESALPSESNRLWFTEGIDFTTPRSAILGPLVTTAGSFGVAPVKIIDFQGATYAIGDDLIAEWTSGTTWTSRETGLSDPIDAIVITDDTDEYLIVSSATEVYYTTDGTTWIRLESFGDSPDFTTYTEVDANTKLTVIAAKATAVNADTDEDVYLYIDKGTNFLDELDVDFEIFCASASQDVAKAGMAISNTVGSINDFATTDISVIARRATPTDAYIELYRGNTVATDSYNGLDDTLYYCTLTRVAANDTVTLKIYSDSSRETLLDTLTVSGYSTTKYRYVYGFVNRNAGVGAQDFDGYIQNLTLKNKRAGYMADYANRLYVISTDGKSIRYSATKDIDNAGGEFTLTGNFGTVYDFFEGKLLADGTPVLYFTGTEGLYTLDTTNEIAYKQEVEYPPLTYSGHVGIYWNGSVWVGTGFGILKVTPSLATFVGPDQDDGLPATYQGSIFDMTTVNNWLVYCVNRTSSSDKSSIIKRNSSFGGNLQVYTSAANKPIATIHHSPSSLYTNGRLWFGEDTDVKYMMFPDTTSNVKQISTYEYVDDSGGSPYSRFPIFRKLAAITKVALGVAAITKSCDSNENIQVFYGLNGAAPTTSLGTFTTSPRPTLLTFGSGLGTEFYTIQFSIKLFRGSTNTNSPELESLLFYYMPRPDVINAWTFNIEATTENADKIITEIEAIRDTKVLVPFYDTGDPAKTVHNVALTSMPLRYRVENLQTRKGTIAITLEEVFSG